jgi:hypothetical protein
MCRLSRNPGALTSRTPQGHVGLFRGYFTFYLTLNILPIPVATRSKPSVCRRLLAGIAGSNFSGAWMSVCCECCVLSGRVPYNGPILRPEESYRVCVCVCVSLSVIRCNNKPSTPKLIGQREVRPRKTEREKEC